MTCSCITWSETCAQVTDSNINHNALLGRLKQCRVKAKKKVFQKSLELAKSHHSRNSKQRSSPKRNLYLTRSRTLIPQLVGLFAKQA
jgi:hypothetical protein